MDREITCVHTAPNGADDRNLGKFHAFDHHSTVFAPKQGLYQKEAVVMYKIKICNCLVGAINALG